MVAFMWVLAGKSSMIPATVMSNSLRNLKLFPIGFSSP